MGKLLLWSIDHWIIGSTSLPDEQLIADLIQVHNADNWLGEEADLDRPLQADMDRPLEVDLGGQQLCHSDQSTGRHQEMEEGSRGNQEGSGSTAPASREQVRGAAGAKRGQAVQLQHLGSR